MKKKKQNKDFKAVEFMRKRRNELSDLYENNPTEFQKQLEEIRKKYKGKFHKKKKQYKINSRSPIAAEPKAHYGKK